MGSTQNIPHSQSTLILGCGAIGGTLAGTLLEAGHDVLTVCRNETVRNAIQRNGFQLSGVGGQRRIQGPVVDSVPQGSFDVVFLATRPADVEAASQAVRSAVKPNGLVVVLQNGLCEGIVAAVLGPERVAGAIVAWGASTCQPGHFIRTSAGGCSLGMFESGTAAGLNEVQLMLECMGAVRRTQNLRGARWSKLGFNCVISTLGTLMGTHLGDALRFEPMRRFGLGIITEVVAVAMAEEVRLEPIGGPIKLQWFAQTSASRAGLLSNAVRHVALRALALRYGKLRSSMLRAIEEQKQPDVDFLNGEIVHRARKHGLSVPFNEAATAGVWQLARGQAEPGLPLLLSCLNHAEKRS